MLKIETLATAPTFKRSQMLFALGKYHAYDSTAEIPSFYKHRIKRLIDIDRELDDYADAPRLIPPSSQLGKGTDHAFTPVDVFCLGIAMEMLDIGFKQREVVISVRFLRQDLDVLYKLIMKKNANADYKNYEITSKSAVFLLFDKTEFVELLPKADLMDFEGLVIRKPKVCKGYNELKTTLIEALNGNGRSLVLELTAPAIKLTGLLADAPLRKRGVG